MSSATIDPPELPRWDATVLHESVESRTFVDSLERIGADVARTTALFDEHDVRATAPRVATPADGRAADQVIAALNATMNDLGELRAFVHSFVSTDSFDDTAQSVASRIQVLDAKLRPLLARFSDWVAALGPDGLATVSPAAGEHAGPLQRLAERAQHQMSEAEEGLYAELSTSGPTAWARLHADTTSQLSADVHLPDGSVERLPMAAVRGLATHHDPATRRAAYDAELATWPTVAVACTAAMNGIKGDAVVVNRRRGWDQPLDASLFANSVGRPTFEAMHAAVVASLPDFRAWMRRKARLHGGEGGLAWWDLVAPLPFARPTVSWHEGLDIVDNAFTSYGPALGALVGRAVSEQWVDAGPRSGKVGGAFCMKLTGDRSLVLLNWQDSVDSVQTLAHELGHAYHNTQLADRTALQRMLPMALAETASIFCETLVVEEGLARLQGADRLALLDVDLQGATQVVVDIHSRFLFEQSVFERRAQRTLAAAELNELMLAAQAEAYGDGLDQTTAHPYMWAVKPHYYGAHFYNWPYTYGLLFGLGLYAIFREDPDRFRTGYDDLLSRAGMETAEELGAAFGLDVTDEAFWTASLAVLRRRISDYDALAADLDVTVA
ncbi:MAG: M3 family oligoendopeptidase [Acidimicrobiia bacterium]